MNNATNLIVDSKVTVVILAKKEEHTIGKVIDKTLLGSSVGELIVIVDNMLDPSAHVAREKGVRVIENIARGKGAAIKMAIAQIDSDVLVFMDADGSHNPDDIPKIIQPILEAKADLVIASRMLGGSEEFCGSIQNILHYIGNRLSSFIVNLIWPNGKKLTDCNNGFRAIRSDIAKELTLKEDGFVIEQEMTTACLKRKYRVVEIPSYEFKRQYGKSHVNPIKTLPRHIWCFIKDIFYN